MSRTYIMKQPCSNGRFEDTLYAARTAGDGARSRYMGTVRTVFRALWQALLEVVAAIRTAWLWYWHRRAGATIAILVAATAIAYVYDAQQRSKEETTTGVASFSITASNREIHTTVTVEVLSPQLIDLGDSALIKATVTNRRFRLSGGSAIGRGLRSGNRLLGQSDSHCGTRVPDI